MSDKTVTMPIDNLWEFVRASVIMGQANPKKDTKKIVEVIKTLIAKELIS